MKKTSLLLVLLILLSVLATVPAFADEAEENDESWKTQPVITKLYEKEKGKIFLEWTGSSSCYRINVDGEKKADMQMNHAVIDLKEGQHQIKIVPLGYHSKDISGSIALDLDKILGGKIGVGSIEGSIDLGDMGKDIVFGTPSETFQLDYAPSKILDAKPEILNLETDDDHRVVITFTDKYKADIYRIAIQSGKDVNTVDFPMDDGEAAPFVRKENTTVTIVLDQEYLDRRECFTPELDEEYAFSVRLRKYPVDLVSHEKETDTVFESKFSSAETYAPVVRWKNAVDIQVSTQAGEGSVLLKWEHDNDGRDLRYKVLEIEKLLGVKTGEKVLGVTDGKEFEIHDLVNGTYTFAVIPVLGEEEGEAAVVDVEVTADWLLAPELNCEAVGPKEVRLTWNAADKVDSYHITVSAGSGSLLRLVNLDYKKIAEFDVPVTADALEYTYTYAGALDPDNGVKLKFEICGVHHVPGQPDQQSSTSSRTVLLQK